MSTQVIFPPHQIFTVKKTMLYHLEWSVLVKTVKVIRTKGVELPESWIAYGTDKSSWVFHRTTGTVVRKEHSNS